MEAVERSGFGERGRIIHLFVGGSELHGAKVKDTDDLDIYGAYVEAPEWMIGLDRREFHVWSTAGNDRRNGPGDIDVCLYSLRKWAGLAAKGNPTALHFLFAGNAVKDFNREEREGGAKDAERILKRGDEARTEWSVSPHPSAENAERVGHPASGHPHLAENGDAAIETGVGRSPAEGWDRVVERRDVFLSRAAAKQFRGFADAQVRRLQGIGTGKKGQRHELIGERGYDVKAAMHVIRLLGEGIELMETGRITLPRPEKELLVTIRVGQYGSLERVLSLAQAMFAELEEAQGKSALPEVVDREAVSRLVTEIYLEEWGKAE
jgi:hypothetical protein